MRNKTPPAPVRFFIAWLANPHSRRFVTCPQFVSIENKAKLKKYELTTGIS